MHFKTCICASTPGLFWYPRELLGATPSWCIQLSGNSLALSNPFNPPVWIIFNYLWWLISNLTLYLPVLPKLLPKNHNFIDKKSCWKKVGDPNSQWILYNKIIQDSNIWKICTYNLIIILFICICAIFQLFMNRMYYFWNIDGFFKLFKFNAN